jgi:hypothetical protein
MGDGRVPATSASGYFRLFNVVSGIAYVVLFFVAYRVYLSVEWGYTGLLYKTLGPLEIAFVLINVIIVSYALPSRLASPSSVVVWFLYCFVHVPTMVITFMIGERDSWHYVPSLAAMSLVMAAAAALAGRNQSLMTGRQLPDLQFAVILTSAFGASSLLLYQAFGDILSFSSLDDVYFQRFAASEIGGGAIGYLRTHYAFLITSLLYATGLCVPRYRVLAVLGLAGSVLTYMIDGSKISLIFPVIVVSFYLAQITFSSKTHYFTAGLAALTGICTLLTSQLSIIKTLADLVLLRSIAIPAQTFAQYADLFAARGHTYWSNVRGINLFVPPPPGFLSDPFWPVLGQIVGAEYYGFGSRMNANANLFVGEGVAASDALGVIVIGVALIAFLHFLDRAAARWHWQFGTIAAVPLGLGLTNTHLSTLLLSFGGFLLWAVLRFYKA